MANIEPLEGRLMMAARPDAAMTGLELLDADRVRITYAVSATSVPQSWTVGLYRSADDRFDPATDERIGSWTVGGGGLGLLSGAPSSGGSSVDLTLDRPFTIVPRKPFVLAVVDPLNQVAEADESNNVAAERRHTVVIVTHGGFQRENAGRVPPWQNRLGKELAAQGYDDVMLYNWVGESKIAGATRQQPGRLVHRLEQRLQQIPEGEPVDLHFISHSQGTVISGLALSMLDREPLPQQRGGVIKATLIDPHAADNGAPLKQYSIKENFAGWVAKLLVNDYQGRANDPGPRVPSNVDEAEVYYQHTHISLAPQDDQQWVNLWGQVPVRGAENVEYHDVTGVGISHSGPYAVMDWYREHVLPTLGYGQVAAPPPILTTYGLDPSTGSIREVRPARGHLAETYSMETDTNTAPRFLGQSWPGGVVRVTAGPIGVSTERPITLGTATTGANGWWSIESPELRSARYTVIASAVIPSSEAHPRIKLTPRIRVGQLTVAPPRTRR